MPDNLTPDEIDFIKARRRIKESNNPKNFLYAKTESKSSADKRMEAQEKERKKFRFGWDHAQQKNVVKED